MCYVVLPPDLQKKSDMVKKYRKGCGFVPNTPEYIKKYDKEIDDYYDEATHTPDGKPMM